MKGKVIFETDPKDISPDTFIRILTGMSLKAFAKEIKLNPGGKWDSVFEKKSVPDSKTTDKALDDEA